MRVRLIYLDNGGGLTRDADVLTAALRRAGARVGHYRLGTPNLAHRLGNRLSRLARRHQVDLNLFLENGPSPGLLASAKRNVLVPNPEWMDSDTAALLDQLDLVACKSADALTRLAGFARPLFLLGFTGRDRLLSGCPRPAVPRALHVAGKNPHKGTQAVYEAWRRRPEWPVLTIVATADLRLRYGLHPAANIRLECSLPDDGLRRLQNEATLHLCPSECEGYGHTIAEAMSCGGLVVSTDAPPMNEIVQPHRGILVPSRSSRPLRFGTWHEVTAEDLSVGVERALSLPPAEAIRLGQAARQWFLANQAAFEERLAQLVAGAPGEAA